MELTNEEIAKVLSLYIGHTVNGWYNGLEIKSIISYSNLEGLAERIKNKNGKLLITQIENISDEDAINVAKILYTDWHLLELDDVDFFLLERAKKYLRSELNYAYNVFQYLISKGYAVPLFFAPNHWANGKTALELGTAIEK